MSESPGAAHPLVHDTGTDTISCAGSDARNDPGYVLVDR